MTNKSAAKVLMFAPRSNGNVAPFRVLQGAATGLHNPQGVAVDGSGNVYVTDIGGTYGNVVLVYAPGPNGNQAPIRKIYGTNTGLTLPLGVTADNIDGELFVSNPSVNTITGYRLSDNGNVTPFATIVGSNTKLTNPAFIQFYRICDPGIKPM